jgi:hypothetical protein
MAGFRLYCPRQVLACPRAVQLVALRKALAATASQ